MKKITLAYVFLLVIAIALFSSYAGLVFGASKSESAIPQNGDLCGGTSGNGEITSVGSNTFTLKLNDGGQKGGGNLIVKLTDRTIIETKAGFVSLSDLKTGNRVTLVGDNHGDGTFTADTVVGCSGTGEIGAQEDRMDQSAPIAVRNKNPGAYEKASNILNITTILLVGLIWLSIVMYFGIKRRKSLVYLLFFTIFYIYMYKVLDYTLIQFQSLLILQHFLPNLMLNGFKDGTNVNFVPLVTLRLEDVKTTSLNILMMMPFGFGLPFITNFRFKKVVVAGLLLSIVIEFLQLITGFMANTTFRVADVNDLVFNTIGVVIGYMLFVGFVRNFRKIIRIKTLANPILQYIAERPQVNNGGVEKKI